MFGSKRRIVSTRLFSQVGQSLIEVMFASAVVALVLVAILSTVILSLQQARLALEQTQATQRAQTTVEWIRAQRDREGWGTFYSGLAARGVNQNQTYCWQTLPANLAAWTGQQMGACDEDDTISNTDMTRTVVVRVVPGTPESVEVSVEISRPGQGAPIVNTINTTLTGWE